MTALPKNESTRLKALYDCQILDTLPENPFDDLTKLAAQLCDCPFAMITFIDESRQWFKSAYNLNVQESPRRGNLCEFAILENDFFEVPDMAADERFRDHPCVLGVPHIRSYAAVPISPALEINIGLICVLDQKARRLDKQQIDSLKRLARMVNLLLQARKTTLALTELVQLRNESEKNLARLSQLSSLAEMAGGLAHEISNPLTIIQLTLDTLRRNLEFLPDYEEAILNQFARLEGAAERIQKITRGLVTYARDSRGDPPVLTPLKSIIDDTLQFCLRRLKQNRVSLEVDELNSDLCISCRPVEISQVLLNLINNACDAVENLPQRWIRISVKPSKSRIEIRVLDSGDGIPLSLQSEIFRPFFTTKELHRGTGLGLGICRSIVENHGGKLFIDNKSPNTCFAIRLPRKARLRLSSCPSDEAISCNEF